MLVCKPPNSVRLHTHTRTHCRYGSYWYGISVFQGSNIPRNFISELSWTFRERPPEYKKKQFCNKYYEYYIIRIAGLDLINITLNIDSTSIVLYSTSTIC